ncbi:UNVERIFIED_CONTAM: hypothetical protein Scaly_2396200 [Sesamum calycinum]|uniref:BAH domain-containing protein n=1 Tax=Sesamum calycinum TaxID=2727403 RepID=A0AAW2M1G0_9LAMI
MGNRRFAQVAISDDEDNTAPPSRNSKGDENQNQRKRKRVHLPDDDEEEEEAKLSEQDKNNKKKKKKKSEEPEPDVSSENEEQEDLEAQPLGEVVRVSGKGRGRRSHYASFEYDGLQYQLEDPVLLVPEKGNQKPYVAIIKDIAQTRDGAMMVTGQWFYRPEEAEKRGGGNWQSSDTRELFYSFHRDEVPAESVMHKCVVHFIPLHKQIPHRKQHPGFIVQKVYDTEQRRLFKLTDKDYEDNKQHEIDLLVQKTLARLGDLPDLEPGDANVDHEDQIKNKRLLRRRNVSPLDVSREEEGVGRSQSFKAETPGSAGGITSEYHTILSNFKLLTGETQRDKWLEKLLQSIQFVCAPVGNKQNDEEEHSDHKNASSNHRNESHDKVQNGDASFDWPDAAVPVVAALEKAAHDTLSADFQKYNQKMRQLAFNLKEGLTAEELASRQPEESERMQMTDARCKRCMEKQVGLTDIIQTGHGDRYQLECVACGNTWYASRDDAAALTIEGPNSGKIVGTAPLATAKFEDVEKNLVSPRGAERGANDVLKKTTGAFVPVLENQRSFNKTRVEETPATTKAK